MLSKKMYAILSCFPRSISATVRYEDLLEKCELSAEESLEFLDETLFPNWNYVRSSNGFNNGSELSLTESGLAKVEEYEDGKRNNQLVLASLAIAIVAMIASVASAVGAFLALRG